MNAIEIGKQFEEKAKVFFKQKGYKIIKHLSEENWSSPYDFLILKSNKKTYVEVRGRNSKQNFLAITKKKLIELKKERNGFLLFINNNGFFFINLNKIDIDKEVNQISEIKIYTSFRNDTQERKCKPLKIMYRCVKCSSPMTYLRLKDNERVCRTCGYIEKLNNSDGKK